MSQTNAARIPRWAWAGLAMILLLDVWYRGHTIGPTVLARTGLQLWPVVSGGSEPLDCDEAVYAYIGKRIAGGSVMYRDLTENKPPGGYWLYAAAAAIGGANELTIRLMPIPMVLATISLVWWIGLRLRGPGAACVAAFLYAVLSTDPFLFGNGANMEHAINLFAIASLALMIEALLRRGGAFSLAAGACLGFACLVKQVVIVHFPIYLAALLLVPGADKGSLGLRDKLTRALTLGTGFAAVWGLAAGVLLLQGAGRAAFEDIFRYGAALVTDTPADPAAPPFLVRCVTGNADPAGGLPPPFGRSTYLVWWGTGSWPLWLASVPCLGWLLLSPASSASRRTVAAWTFSACAQVVWPRLFWQHYYLLPTPGIALAVATCIGDAFGPSKSTRRSWTWITGLSLLIAVITTVILQIQLYLSVAPEELTGRYKGGRQWVALRSLSKEITNRSRNWKNPHLFIWGWQSPLYVYTGFDGASRQVFVDPLIKAFATTDHPLIRPRVARIMNELREKPPELVLAGDPPFPALRDFLYSRYLRSRLVPQAPDGRGLWIVREKFDGFEYGPH